MSKVVIVTGVPGSGKSTIINEALDGLKSKGIEYALMNYSDVMFELMRGEGGVSHRDDLRKVPMGRYRQVQLKAAQQIARAAAQWPILLNTHCRIKKPEGYYPGLPRQVLEQLSPELIILAEAKLKEVAGRRARERDRPRDEDLVPSIDEHQQLNRAAALAYTAISGATVEIIQNSDKGLRRAVEEVVVAMR